MRVRLSDTRRVSMLTRLAGRDSMSNPYDVERTWPDYFLEHRKLFEDREGGRGTYKCGDHPVWTVHAPLGYLGNSTFIEGDDGVIVYDTSMGIEPGEHVLAELRKVTDKPIRAIFYSHHHADHYQGAAALVETSDVEAGKVKIYAWENFTREMANEFGEILPRQAMGAAYYGGAVLPPEDKHHHGIALNLSGTTPGYIPPTDLLDGDTTLEIAGVSLNVFYTGGEAISEFGIHIPEFDMVLIADEFFSGIPNMHTIRGSKPRIADNYVRALERVLEIQPEWLVGSHIRPLEGKDRIREAVTTYRDVTQYLWDQSVRLINKGYTPIELQHALADIPEHFVDPPYTVPMYGTPFTTVPEFFTGWVSWFTGDATDLNPSTNAHRAEVFVGLMGGVESVLEAAKSRHRAGEHQIAAELAQLALRADAGSDDARLVKAAALRARGYQELNPIARSWYLTGALELEGAFDPEQFLGQMMQMFATAQSVEGQIANWRYKLDAEAAGTTSAVVGVRATDTDGEWTVRLRNSVLVVTDGVADDRDVVVEAESAALAALPDTSGVQVVEGDGAAWERLVGLLDLGLTGFAMHQR
jgi:alkyl sulfatase BDS1-like metallo-beta-lactamase superfamily hydrolase